MSDARQHPLVSVIIPFLNGDKFIHEAIESVFAQTYREWELILVDDGSTDRSTDIARQHARRRPGQVRYVEHDAHQNRGQSASRNTGIKLSTGPLLAFLDCDDVWRPVKLARQVAILEQHPHAGMVCGASEYWRSWPTSPPSAEDSIPQLGVPHDTLFNPPDLLKMLYPLGPGTAPCPSDLMIRREVAATTGGFPEEFRGANSLFEDQGFLVKVYYRHPVFISGESWTRYRIHPDSLSAQVQAAGQSDAVRLYFLNYLERFLTAEGVEDPEIWNLLRKALWRHGRTLSIGGADEVDVRALTWDLRVAGDGNRARLEFPNEDSGSLRVAISSAVTRDPWDIQLNHAQLTVDAEQRYRLTFRARADRSRSVNVGFSMAHEPWLGLGLYQKLDLTERWSEHNFEFTASASDEDARIHFDVGGSAISVEVGSVTASNMADGRMLGRNLAVQGQYPQQR